MSEELNKSWQALLKRHGEGDFQHFQRLYHKAHWGGILKYWYRMKALEFTTMDCNVDAFDIAHFKYEKEMDRINNLSKKKRKRELKRREREISCLDCCNKTIYEGWCCRFNFDEYPNRGYECCCYNEDV